MACRTAVMTSYEEPVNLGSSSSCDSTQREDVRQRRRHSSYHARSWSLDSDNIQQLVDRFLLELERRLDLVETFGQFNVEDGIEKAYHTLNAVREGCSHVSDEVIDAGRRRAKIMVDTLEERWDGAVARKATLEQKVQQGVRHLEGLLAEFEGRAYAVRDAKLAAAGELFDSGWRHAESKLQGAKDFVDESIDKAQRAKENLKLKIDSAVKRAREHGLINYEDLPEPWRVNKNILRGYRFNETKLECFRSLFSPSNEFFNVWSHLIGLAIVLSIALYFYPISSTFSASTKADITIATLFFAAACKCLLFSCLWHTMSSISHQSTMERFACVDYTGISLLVATSIITTIWTAFYCDPLSRWTYLALTLCLGIGGTILPWHPTFNRADMAGVRVIFYIVLAATGFVPFVQLAATHGLSWAMHFYAPICKSIAVYLAGAILYAGKVPERFCPGMFDYVGGSHNIWHVAVLGGILFHYGAMQEFFRQAFVRAQGEGNCSVY